jgi:hypothetical protein
VRRILDPGRIAGSSKDRQPWRFHPESLTELLGLDVDVQVQIVLSLGYPGRPQDPQARPPEEVARRL